jgi:hypothetical protein
LPLCCRSEAQADAASEPLLSSFLYASILGHSSFELALAFVLANRLANTTMLPTQVRAGDTGVWVRSCACSPARVVAQRPAARARSCPVRSFSAAPARTQARSTDTPHSAWTWTWTGSSYSARTATGSGWASRAAGTRANLAAEAGPSSEPGEASRRSSRIERNLLGLARLGEPLDTGVQYVEALAEADAEAYAKLWQRRGKVCDHFVKENEAACSFHPEARMAMELLRRSLADTLFAQRWSARRTLPASSTAAAAGSRCQRTPTPRRSIRAPRTGSAEDAARSYARAESRTARRRGSAR